MPNLWSCKRSEKVCSFGPNSPPPSLVLRKLFSSSVIFHLQHILPQHSFFVIRQCESHLLISSVWTLIRSMSDLSTCEAFHYSTSSSSSTSSTRKNVSINILTSLFGMLPSLRASTSLSLNLRFIPLFLGFLISILGNLFASWLTFALASLTLFLSQLLFIPYSHLIRIFHHSDGLHAHLILNVISQTIHVPSNLFIIAFAMTYPNVQLVEFFSVLLHYHQLLPQILHSPKQSNLVIHGNEFYLHLRDHPIQTLDFLLAFAASVIL
jgi:hypothetical protein